jgi:hypothetical protein
MTTPFSSIICAASEQCKHATEERLSAKRVHEYNEVTTSNKRTSTGTGSAQLSHLFRLLDSFGLKRSNIQIQLHKGMAGSVLERIFCNDSDAEMKLAMQRHKIGSCRQQFMAITPRRFGKTTAVSMFVAAFALAVPGTQTAIFSTGRRASSLLLQQIKSMLCLVTLFFANLSNVQVPGASDQIVSSNVESIVLSIGQHQSKISSFPGKAKT